MATQAADERRTRKESDMIARTRSLIVVTLVLALAACGSGAAPASNTSTPTTSTTSNTETTAPVEQSAVFLSRRLPPSARIR
jgi:hypothetical protein